jgi:CheY-like chemotaxis protein
MTGRRVLVVDDEANVRDVLSRTLGRKGYTVYLAATADDACDLLKAQAIDAVVMDLHMPVMSGRTLFHVILSQWPALKHRIAVMTDVCAAESHEPWLQLYNPPVITKPFRLAELSAVVDSLTEELRREVNGS